MYASFIYAFMHLFCLKTSINNKIDFSNCIATILPTGFTLSRNVKNANERFLLKAILNFGFECRSVNCG